MLPPNSGWVLTHSNSQTNTNIKPPANATACQAAGARERLRCIASWQL